MSKVAPKFTNSYLFIFTLIFSLIFTSCGKSVAQKKEDAIISANILLTKKKCDAAIALLEGVGRDVNDVNYLKALGSAYACKGGFGVLKLFQDDLPLVATPAPMGGASRFSTSSTMDSPTNEQYVNLQKAIDLLLYAGGISKSIDPTVARRAALFSANDAAEINSFLMYMLLVQLGRYFYFYGNASAAGAKGAGAGANDCFMNYENVNFAPGATAPPLYDNMTDFLAGGLTGSCVLINTGHASLGAMASINIPRACEGVVLLNNFFAVFPSVIASIGGTDFSDIASLETLISTGKSSIETHKVGSDAKVSNSLSQTKCEADNAGDDDYIQTYFAFLMETLVQ